MTREEAKEILLSGGTLHHFCWTFTAQYMFCGSETNCCSESFEDIDDALDAIETYSSGDWDDVRSV